MLASNKVDDQTLGAIEAAELDLVKANAQLDMEAPSLCISALADCSFSMNGTDIILAEGEIQKHTIADSSRLTLPGALDIEIVAGSSTEGLSKKVEVSRGRLDAACTVAGVANPDEARTAFEKRREASLHVEIKAHVEKENLRDLSYDELEERLRILQKSVPAYLQERAAKPTVSSNQDSAKAAQVDAESAQAEANWALDQARAACDAARGLRETLYTKHREAHAQLEVLAKSLSNAEGSLANARERVADDVLEVNVKENAGMVAAEAATVSSADSALKAKNPEGVRTLLETANGSLQTTRGSRQAAGTELAAVEARLRLQGEQGLQEKLDVARVQVERISHACQSLSARAAVAKLLFESMRDERDRARRAYVAPLKEKIEQLGRLVFDDAIQVDIDDDLQIASRTSGGITIPFESLSGGAKEQLSLIFRLVCSMIVAQDGGTPFILDDALGYSDPERLLLMNAVLAKAAKDCQIIVLTCIPDRYSNLGQATVISLA